MLLLTIATLAGAASAVQIDSTFKTAVSNAAQDVALAQATGTQNCFNKCQNMFNTMAYTVNTGGVPTTNGDTYEYSACRVGCEVCSAVIAANEPDWHKCFYTCKQTDWLKNVDINGDAFPIVKGVIEPDKACIFGCIIGTCQDVCQGGSPDDYSPDNAAKWWDSSLPGTGCTIKTGAIRPGGYYSQNSDYNYWNQPPGVGGQKECCSNAYSLCNYEGPKGTTNYNKVVAQAKKYCASVPGAGNNPTAICTFFNDPANCGNPLS
jgi:hypothetical protein